MFIRLRRPVRVMRSPHFLCHRALQLDHGAVSLRQAALRKATRSRKEEEWLERQLEAAAKKAADLQRINDDVLKEQQERVRGQPYRLYG